MKNLVCIFFAVFSIVLFADSVEDRTIVFSTKGPDVYADGTQVLDGESYALVWTQDGVFEGFSADGKVIDDKDRLLVVAPVAKGGRCPKVMFQIPVVDAVQYGQYNVFLLDTRVVSQAGVVSSCAPANGEVKLVNGYGQVSAEITLSASSSKAEIETVANLNSGIPKDTRQPRIKAMRIEGDQVVLSVENMPGFMRVQSGADAFTADSTGVALETPDSGDTLTIVAPKAGERCFYRVIRSSK